MEVSSKIAAAALRGVLEAVESDPSLAGEVLARVLGAPAVAPAPVKAKPRRPSRALPAAQKKRHGPKVVEDVEAGARLVAGLVERYGTLADAARATGERLTSLRRWKNGTSIPTPETVARLEALLAAPAEAEPAEQPQGEAAGLVVRLEEACGSLEGAGERFGLSVAALERWKAGGPASSTALGRLREAVEACADREARAAAGRSVPRGSAGPFDDDDSDAA